MSHENAYENHTGTKGEAGVVRIRRSIFRDFLKPRSPYSPGEKKPEERDSGSDNDLSIEL